jgi:hypothetical protein
MWVTWDEMHTQVEPGRLQKSHESRNGRLPTIPLVCRDHRRRHSSPFAELPLAETTLYPGQLEQCGSWSGDLRRLCHNTSVLVDPVFQQQTPAKCLIQGYGLDL